MNAQYQPLASTPLPALIPTTTSHMGVARRAALRPKWMDTHQCQLWCSQVSIQAYSCATS